MMLLNLFPDPKEDDKVLWATSDRYLHPRLDPETAKFILRYTAEEFCKMVKQEMDVRGHYFGNQFFLTESNLKTFARFLGPFP